MPELPEVEAVRRSLEGRLRGCETEAVTVLHPRPVCSHPAGPEGFVPDLANRDINAVAHRGKYLRLVLGDDAMITHLGTSGQFRVNRSQDSQLRNTRVLFNLDDGTQLRFVNQCMFSEFEFVRGGGGCPTPYIALGPFNLGFGPAVVACWVRARCAAVERTIPGQGLVSEIGNTYTDGSLWCMKLYFDHPTQHLIQARAAALLGHARDVMSEALAVGGTSFDSLHVNVNGESGYFECRLSVYGHGDQPCRCCAASVIRQRLANRSSFLHPRRQRLSKS